MADKKRLKRLFILTGVIFGSLIVVSVLEAYTGYYLSSPYLYCNSTLFGFGQDCPLNGTIYYNETHLNATIEALDTVGAGNNYTLNLSTDSGSGSITDAETLTVTGSGATTTSMLGNTVDINTPNLTSGEGILRSGDTFSLNESFQLPQGCASDKIPKWNGTGWECATDQEGGGGGSPTAPSETHQHIYRFEGGIGGVGHSTINKTYGGIGHHEIYVNS